MPASARTGVLIMALGLPALIMTTGVIAVSRATPASAQDGTVRTRLVFGPGDVLVGPQIGIGFYRSGPASRCSWERFGARGKVLDRGSVRQASRVIVEIRPGDTRFSSRGCGTWVRVK